MAYTDTEIAWLFESEIYERTNEVVQRKAAERARHTRPEYENASFSMFAPNSDYEPGMMYLHKGGNRKWRKK